MTHDTQCPSLGLSVMFTVTESLALAQRPNHMFSETVFCPWVMSGLLILGVKLGQDLLSISKVGPL